MNVSLADQIRKVFHKFQQTATKSSDRTPVSVLVCWRQTLFDIPDEDLRFYEAMAIVQAAVSRLSMQTNKSSELTKQAKKTATDVISGLARCIHAENLPKSAHSFSILFNDDKLGSLDLLSSALRREFPERQSENLAIQNLIAEVKELQKAIVASEIDWGLRAILIHQISVLQWTLEHADFVGSQGVKDSVARVALSCQELPAVDTDGGKPETEPSLRTRVATLVKDVFKAFKLFEDVDSGLSALEHLTQVAVEAAQDVGDVL
jgi:hypothetical protein